MSPSTRMPPGYRPRIPILVSKAAPSSTGVLLSKMVGMTLVAFVRKPYLCIVTATGCTKKIDISQEQIGQIYCFCPLIVITVCLTGRTFPDFFTASSTILCNPKQQGTSILTSVMVFILLVFINSVNLSI
jgi:hypothetical protein